MTRQQLFLYSLLAIPLAFVELPLFVTLPKFYAAEGLNLAVIGYVLLGVRSLDALKDPILGYAADYFYKTPQSRFRMIGLFAPLLAIGFYLLWTPPFRLILSCDVVCTYPVLRSLCRERNDHIILLFRCGTRPGLS